MLKFSELLHNVATAVETNIVLAKEEAQNGIDNSIAYIYNKSGVVLGEEISDVEAELIVSLRTFMKLIKGKFHEFIFQVESVEDVVAKAPDNMSVDLPSANKTETPDPVGPTNYSVGLESEPDSDNVSETLAKPASTELDPDINTDEASTDFSKNDAEGAEAGVDDSTHYPPKTPEESDTV